MKFKILGTISIATLLLSGCNHPQEESGKKIETKKELTATTIPKFGNFINKISVTASVQPSPDGIVNITTPINASIDKIDITIGQHINIGSPLLSLRSTEISDATNQHISAKAGYEQAKKIYDMNKELYKLGAITNNDLLNSKTNLEQSKALMDGFAQKLSYYGSTSGQTLMLRSPIQGVVYEVNTHLGEKVNVDGNALVKVASLEKKVVIATVYEKDLSAFEIGKEVDITTDTNEYHLKGIVTYVSDVLDPENKTNKVYIRPIGDLKNLKINMFINVLLNKEEKNLFRIPKKSLLFKDGKFYVYLKEISQFKPQIVTLIKDDPNDEFSLVRGIKPNTPIALEAIAMEKE